MEDKEMAEVGTRCTRRLPFGDCECATATKVTDVANETKTKLLVHDGIIRALFFKNGVPIGDGTLLPDISDVKVINKKVVVVKFADNTEEKAVLDSADTYSLEQGISICITKKLLGRNTPFGGSLYNKIIKRAMDVMEENEKAAKFVAEQEKAANAKAEKVAAKKKAHAMKIAALKKEDEIEMHKEAYLRAMRELRDEEKKEMDEALGELGDLFEQLIKQAEAEAENNSEEQANQTVAEMNNTQE